jgi:hypothetical protein
MSSNICLHTGVLNCYFKQYKYTLEEIREKKQAVLQRQYRAYMLPTNNTVKDVEKRWDEFKVNPHSSGSLPAFNAADWTKPGEFVKTLRRLAVDGAKQLQREQQEAGSQQKVVHEWVQMASGAHVYKSEPAATDAPVPANDGLDGTLTPSEPGVASASPSDGTALGVVETREPANGTFVLGADAAHP